MQFLDIRNQCYDNLLQSRLHRHIVGIIRAIEDCSPPGKRMLIAGRGIGNIYTELKSRGFDIVWLDSTSGISDTGTIALPECRERNLAKNMKFYSDRIFDCIVSLNILYALKCPEEIFNHYHRLLRPGGRLILVEPRYPIKVFSNFKETYNHGGLSNSVRCVLTQAEVVLGNLLMSKKVKIETYHSYDDQAIKNNLIGSKFVMQSTASIGHNNSLILARAVKPRHYFEMDKYVFRTAETNEDLNSVFEFRHRIYCEELHIRPLRENNLEKDIHDEYAINFLCINQNNNIVAVLRAVYPSSIGFSMEPDFQLSKYMKSKGITTGVECGRWAIDKHLSAEERPIIYYGLFKCLVEHCMSNGITHIYNFMWEALARKWAMPGFRQIGNGFKYSKFLGNPIVVPMECDLQYAYDHYLKGPFSIIRD